LLRTGHTAYAIFSSTSQATAHSLLMKKTEERYLRSE